MDPATKHRLSNYFRSLDRALASGNRLQARIISGEINRILESTQMEEQPGEEIPIPGAVPGWAKEIIRDRGLRLKSLERALNAHRITIVPTTQGVIPNGFEIKGTF